MPKKLLVCLLLLASMVFATSPGWAQNSPLLKKAAKEKIPLVITAQRAEFDTKAHKAVYKGSVKVVRGDVTMYSNQLEAFLDQEGKEIDYIVASGDVKILQEKRVITAQKAVYYEAEQKVVLTGEPVSRQGKNVVEGKRMTYFFNQERIVVEEAKSVLHPDKTKKQDKTSRQSSVGKSKTDD